MTDCRSTRRWWTPPAVFAWLMFAATAAADDQSIRPLSGKPLADQLARQLSITWVDQPLRQGLSDLSRHQRVAIVLDRRVDPGRALDLTIDQAHLEAALRGVAEGCGLSMSMYGPVAYLGPTPAATRLRTLAALLKEETRRFPLPVQKRLLTPRRWQWDDLATPRDLLDALAAEGQFTLPDRDRIPRDLWPAAELPPLSLTDRLLLVVVQFDLTCRLSDDGAVVRFVPIPEQVELRREYPAGGRAEELADAWRSQLPAGRVEVAGDRVIVHALLEDHERLRGDSRPAAEIVAQAEQVYTLKIENVPLDALLKQLEQRLAIQVQLDGEALAQSGIQISQRVSLDVSRVTLDELLAAALRPAGLAHVRRGNQVEVRPADRP